MQFTQRPLSLLITVLLATSLGQQASADTPVTTADAKASVSTDAIEEILVVKRRESDYSVITERAQKIVDVPGALGDPLMAVFSLPGVLSQGEAGAPAVRGSSPSDNRYMVDGAPAGYVFHAFSTSVFNENIIQDFELYSAGFGPRYSNAIGGVFDIQLREPKHQDFSTKIDVGVLRSGVFVEGEATENSALYLSARGSMLQYFFDDKQKEETAKTDGINVETPPQDTDYQFKYVYDLDANQKFTLSANGATDLARADFTNSSKEVMEDPDFQGDAKIKNAYTNLAASWHSAHEQGGALDLKIGRYVNDNELHWGDQKYFFNLRNKDTYFIINDERVVKRDHSVTLGAEIHDIRDSYGARLINYVCTETDPDCLYRRGDVIAAANTLAIREASLYTNDHWALSEDVAVDLGLQAHYNDFTKEHFLHPRASLAWHLTDGLTLSSSAGSYDRFPDMDKLFPEIGNAQLKSPTSNHYTLGLKQTLPNEWSWSVTAYYKTMDKLPLAMGVNETPNYTNHIEGEAYGLDVFVNKELTDRWYGWMALSTSKSTRTNELTRQKNNYRLDTPVVFNLVLNYKLTPLWTSGMRFTAQSGRAFTPILGVQKNPYFDNHLAPIYGEPFSDNLPVYSRLDLRFKRDTTFWGYKGTYNIDILNALNRHNVTDRKVDYARTQSPQHFRLEDEVGLGIIPAVGMSVSF